MNLTDSFWSAAMLAAGRRPAEQRRDLNILPSTNACRL